MRRWARRINVASTISGVAPPDSPSIAEVEGTLDHHPERPSCHFAPEAIKTIEGEDEVVLIEFTYGGGATFGGDGGDCGENPGSDLQGVLLASDGVSYSDSLGGDGDFLALSDCSLSEAFGRPCNVPSLPNALWIDALLGFSGYLRFDPPIAEITFRVCSDQSHGLTAWDSLGNQIVPETVGPSNGTSQDLDLYCDSEGWEEFGIQASGYDISRVRLRRWDPGLTYWDDMTFRRASSCQPGLAFPDGPTGDPILDEPAVQNGLYEALEAGNAFDPDKSARVEELGWIFERPDGTVYVKRIPPLEQTACSNIPSSGAVPDDLGDVAIAGFHTHPFADGDILPTSCGDKAGYPYDAVTWGGPSYHDWEDIIKELEAFDIPYYVIDLDNVYAAPGYLPEEQRAGIPKYSWTEDQSC